MIKFFKIISMKGERQAWEEKKIKHEAAEHFSNMKQPLRSNGRGVKEKGITNTYSLKIKWCMKKKKEFSKKKIAKLFMEKGLLVFAKKPVV